MHTLLTAMIIINKRKVREGRWEEGKGYFPSPSSLARFLFSLSTASLRHKRELMQRRRRQLPERRLKSEVELLQTLSRLFHLVQFVKCWQFVLELNSKRLYQSSGKEKESRCIEFVSSTKREIRHFHVVVVQWRRRNVQKSAMHVQNCYFANLNLLPFCRSRCRRRWLSSLKRPLTRLKSKLWWGWLLSSVFYMHITCNSSTLIILLF